MDQSHPLRSYITLTPESRPKSFEIDGINVVRKPTTSSSRSTSTLALIGTIVAFLVLTFVGNLIFPSFVASLYSNWAGRSWWMIAFFTCIGFGLKFGEVATVAIAGATIKGAIVVRVAAAIGTTFSMAIVCYAGLAIMGLAPFFLMGLILVYVTTFFFLSSFTLWAALAPWRFWKFALAIGLLGTAILLMEEFAPKFGVGFGPSAFSTVLWWSAMIELHVCVLLYTMVLAFKNPSAKWNWVWFTSMIVAGPYVFLHFSAWYFRLLRIAPNSDGYSIAYSFVLGFLLVSGGFGFFLFWLNRSHSSKQLTSSLPEHLALPSSR